MYVGFNLLIRFCSRQNPTEIPKLNSATALQEGKVLFEFLPKLLIFTRVGYENLNWWISAPHGHQSFKRILNSLRMRLSTRPQHAALDDGAGLRDLEVGGDVAH